MAIVIQPCMRLLATLLVVAILGCAAQNKQCDCGQGCDSCALGAVACGLYHGTLADEVMCCNAGCLSQSRGICSCPRRATCGPDCMYCRECGLIPLGLAGPLVEKPQPGPPPISFRPQVPPKFLAVPTHPVVSPVRPEAPEPQQGNVEVSYRPELTIPGND
jgi:hypothetical protein